MSLERGVKWTNARLALPVLPSLTWPLALDYPAAEPGTEARAPVAHLGRLQETQAAGGAARWQRGEAASKGLSPGRLLPWTPRARAHRGLRSGGERGIYTPLPKCRVTAA